jgi:hypothetical protein
VNDVIYDQNAYGNMADILKSLGINSKNAKDYSARFGVTLTKRTAQEIEPASGNNLRAEGEIEVPKSSAGSQVEQLHEDFGIQPREVDMLILDMLDIPPQQAPLIITRAPQPSVSMCPARWESVWLPLITTQAMAILGLPQWQQVSSINAINALQMSMWIQKRQMLLCCSHLNMAGSVQIGTILQTQVTSVKTKLPSWSVFPRAIKLG